MDHTDTTAGLAVLCSPEGILRQVIHDGLGLGERLRLGQSFMTFLDPASLSKALAFLETIRSDRAAFDWEMNATIDGKLTSLHLAGGALEGQVLIVAARSRNGAAKLYDEMMRISNEQANALRAALKDQALQARPERDADAYEELARLNNELVTLQRELAKKNHEMERLIAELQSALTQVRQLSGLLPICSSCKQIRDDKGYWHQVEVYVRNHSEAEFSHSLCPDCVTRLYPDLDI